MEPDLSMTREAARICTRKQWDAIVRQLGEARRMRVFVDFSLPEGYLYFIRHTPHYETSEGSIREGGTIHGGIDPQGGIST